MKNIQDVRVVDQEIDQEDVVLVEGDHDQDPNQRINTAKEDRGWTKKKFQFIKINSYFKDRIRQDVIKVEVEAETVVIINQDIKK